MDDYCYNRVSDIYVNPDLTGYLLEKKIMRNVKTWCSLQGPTLYLQKGQNGIVQSIDMATEVQNVRKLNDASQFEINLKKGKSTFICNSSTECSDWVSALIKAMTLKSNGHGQSFFHEPSVVKEDLENPYTDPVDTVLSPQESVYDEVTMDQVIEARPHAQFQQKNKVNPGPAGRPPTLPPMDSRNAQRQNQMNSSEQCGYHTDASSEVPVEGGSEVPEPGDCYYTDATSTNPTETESESNKAESCEYYTDGTSFAPLESSEPKSKEPNSEVQSKPTPDEPSHSPTPDSPVVLRNQPSIEISEDADQETVDISTINFIPSSEDMVDSGQNFGEDPEIKDAFTKLDQVLSCQDCPNLVLQHPLMSGDYEPLENLRQFLNNNRSVLQGASHHRPLLEPEEDPVASLKLFLKQIAL